MKMLMILSSNVNTMSDDLKGAIITAIVTGIISIIGFIATNMSMRKSFKNELAMQRDNTALEKMASIPYETLEFYDITMKLGQVDKQLQAYNKTNLAKAELVQKKQLEVERKDVEDEMLNKMSYLYNTIYAYGSETAIKIVSKMQSTNYMLANNPESDMGKKLLPYMILLATQVKKDVTAISISPKYWLQLRINDYHIKGSEINRLINEVVDELELDKKFKIQ